MPNGDDLQGINMKLKTSTLKNAVAAVALCSSFFALSGEQEEAIKTKLTGYGVVVKSVKQSPVPDFYQVLTSQGIVYVSEDMNFLLDGVVLNMGEKVVNVTEQALNVERVKGLQALKDSVITFKAENEKHQINIFTDITCGYCAKLHSEMEAYNDLGITVNYLAYPRAGVNSRAAKTLSEVWCDKDAQKSMTLAQAGSFERKNDESTAKCDDIIKQHYNFAQMIGVNATPILVAENGEKIRGYRKPEALLDTLENMEKVN